MDYPFLRISSEIGNHYTDNLVFVFFDMTLDLLVYVTFVVVNLVIDVILIKNLKLTLDEKKKKKEEIENSAKGQKTNNKPVRPLVNESLQNGNVKKKKKKEHPVLRGILMIVVNSIFNIALKFPITAKTILNLLLMLNAYGIIVSINLEVLRTLCNNSPVCSFVDELATLLFMVSLSFNIIAYYNFDKKFHLVLDTYISNVFCGWKMCNKNRVKVKPVVK